MSLEFIYQKEVSLDNEKYFTTSMPVKNSIEKKKSKNIAMVSNASHITLIKVPEARFFISRKIYENRNVNFFKGMQFVAGRRCRSTLGYAFDERFVYELELKNVTRRSPSTIL